MYPSDFSPMSPDVVAARSLGKGYARLTFANGRSTVVNLDRIAQGPGFDELRANGQFNNFFVDDELGTIAWPNGMDLSPDVLWAKATGMTHSDHAFGAIQKAISSFTTVHTKRAVDVAVDRHRRDFEHVAYVGLVASAHPVRTVTCIGEGPAAYSFDAEVGIDPRLLSPSG